MTTAGMTARSLITEIHEGSRTVRQIADDHLARIEQVNPVVQVFETVDSDLVRAEADVLDARARAGARLPLHGVPVAVKDIIDVAGLPTIAGFEPYRGSVAETDAAIIARLRELGAMMIGKTHTTQFAVGDPAPTRNPWDQSRSPAGSSAGSGAAVPSATAPVALGSQTAGSMLRPAAFNGSVGFKPGFGWFSLEGVIPLSWSLDHLGIYTADVADMALIYRALMNRPTERQPLDRPPRIAVLTEYMQMADAEVAEHVEAVAFALRDSGATVESATWPVPFEDLFAPHQILFAAEMAAVHSANLLRYPDDYGVKIRAGVEAGALIPSGYLMQARRLKQRHARVINQWMRSFDAVMFPTVSTEACPIAETGDRTLQVPATYLGLPAMSLPTGLSKNGLPLATQLIGKFGSEDGLLDVAEWLSGCWPLIGRPDLG
jgi:aspartyl-tRNA(Asn)/glutamyl-tRNA(Gln) amidotransferase subunit A